MSRRDGTVDLEDCTIKKETEAAFLVVYDGEEHWLPKSQITDPDTLSEGDEGVCVTVTEWIANQKGIDF